MECATKEKIIPHPRKYGLTEDFIYVEQEWGSLFYKHLGKQTRSAAKDLCSNISPNVHLPIPRFHEENEFYKTHFGDEGLWLDVSYDVNEGLKSVDGHSLIRYVRSFVMDKFENETSIEYEYTDMDDLFDDDYRSRDLITEEFIEIKYHDWIKIADMNMPRYFIDGAVFMTNTGDSGEWEWINVTEAGNKGETQEKNQLLGIQPKYDAVCVYNIIPDECSGCSEESFCRYTDSEGKETECVCPQIAEGEYCEIVLSSPCQNGGFEPFSNSERFSNFEPEVTNATVHDEIECICPYPFYGDFCEGRNIIYIGSSKGRKVHV